MSEPVAVMNDQGLAEICRLLERDDMLISPDAVWLSSRPGFYGHLLALDAIAVSRERALDILCPECGTEAMRPQPHAAPDSQPYRGYCPECGWVGLANQQAHYWQVQQQDWGWHRAMPSSRSSTTSCGGWVSSSIDAGGTRFSLDVA